MNNTENNSILKKKDLISQIDKLDKEIQKMKRLIRDTHWDIQDKKKEKNQIIELLKPTKSIKTKTL